MFSEKNWGYHSVTVCSISRKILVCDMESWYKTIFKIRNVTFVLKKFQKRNFFLNFAFLKNQ